MTGQNVLIVEDNDDVRFLLAHRLKRAGLSVSEAINGVNAVEEALRVRPDLIFIDFRLPDMSGSECVRRIREKGLESNCVAITGMDPQMIEDELSSVGVTDIAQKPFSQKKLNSVLSKYLMI